MAAAAASSTYEGGMLFPSALSFNPPSSSHALHSGRLNRGMGVTAPEFFLPPLTPRSPSAAATALDGPEPAVSNVSSPPRSAVWAPWVKPNSTSRTQQRRRVWARTASCERVTFGGREAQATLPPAPWTHRGQPSYPSQDTRGPPQDTRGRCRAVYGNGDGDKSPSPEHTAPGYDKSPWTPLHGSFGHTQLSFYNAINTPGAVLRGELAKELAEKQELDFLHAQRRRRAAKIAGEAHRLRAHTYKQEVERRSRMGMSPVDQEDFHPERDHVVYRRGESFNHMILQMMAPSENDEAGGSVTSQSPSGIRECVDSADDGGQSSDIKSEAAPPASAAPDVDNVDCNEPQTHPNETAGGTTGSLSRVASKKNTREARLRNLTKWCKKGRKQEKIGQLLLERRRQFQMLPCKERKELQEAFEKFDKDRSGSLDPQELPNCLAFFGLKGKTPCEQKELKTISNEVVVLGAVDFLNFSLELVPRARQRLRELRHGELLEEFRACDADNSGYLDEHECKAVLAKLCTDNLDAAGLSELREAFDEIIKELLNSDNLIEFESFQEMVARAREHHERIVGNRVTKIYRSEGLDIDDLWAHSDDLIPLWEAFMKADTTDSGRLNWATTESLLRDKGILDGYMAQSKASKIFRQRADIEGKIAFRDYLRLMGQLSPG